MPGSGEGSDRLEIPLTERVQVVLGVVFGVVGVALLGAAFYLVSGRGFRGEFVPLLGMGAFAAFAGPLLVGSRSKLVLDRRARVVERHSGFFRTALAEARSFDRFREVRLGRYGSRDTAGRGGGTTYYGVTLEGEGLEPPMLRRFRQPVPARMFAEKIARFLGLPLRNSATHMDVVRRPEELDWPLARVIRASGERPVHPARPLGSVLHVEPVGEGYTVEVPPPGFLRGGILWAPIVGPFVFGPMWLAAAFAGADASGPFVRWLGIAAGGFAALVALYSWVRGRKRARLELSPEVFRIHTSYPWRHRTVVLPTEAIEEITYFAWGPSRLGLVDTGGITLFTDREIVSFGAALGEEDQRYLYELLRYVLARE
ncbi:MAG: hypothetical protein KatS3mg076_1768 [Candidatus Binatia bacterium]|nr:MAG: hypothetical protein KatS3mg076_1768 [Candidatus Binatia bacterium]